MKKLLVLAALTMAAAPAMASKARLSSLGNASHLVDAQTLFVNPADLNYVGDFATLEMGDNNATYTTTGVTRNNPKAEGGFTKTLSWGKVGAYLGHRNDTTTAFIDAINVATAAGGTNASTGNLLTEQNPLDLFYGTDMLGMKWGFDLHYSSAKAEKGAVTQKANTLGLSAGVRTDVWDAYARLGLNGKTETDDAAAGSAKLESKGLYKVGGGMWFDSIYAFANYEYAKGTSTVSAADTDITKNQYEVGMVNNHKVEGGNFFYGVSYLSNEVKSESTTSKKTSTSGLPLLVGMELDAASWLTLRGSVKQTVIVGEKKNESASPTTKSNLANDTTVAVGAGLKWGKINVDGSLAGSTTGAVNGNSLLADASLTYMF